MLNRSFRFTFFYNFVTFLDKYVKREDKNLRNAALGILVINLDKSKLFRSPNTLKVRSHSSSLLVFYFHPLSSTTRQGDRNKITMRVRQTVLLLYIQIRARESYRTFIRGTTPFRSIRPRSARGPKKDETYENKRLKRQYSLVLISSRGDRYQSLLYSERRFRGGIGYLLLAISANAARGVYGRAFPIFITKPKVDVVERLNYSFLLSKGLVSFK